MANLILTHRCNRDCAYCFADKREACTDMTVADANVVLDAVQASGGKQVRFLGGEPTLHPDFAGLLTAAVGQGLETLVFSNGWMAPGALAAILRTPPEQCRVMLNVNLGADESPEDRGRVARTAKALGGRAFVGVNIHSPGMPLREAADFAEAHGLTRVIRVGLAHPRLDRGNRYLHPRHYRRVGKELERFFDAIRPNGFSLSFDCGFVPCMFSREFLEQAGVTARDLGRRCGPIPDVLPDLTAIHCFPLGDMDQLPLSGIGTLREMRTLHEARTRAFGAIGIFRECAGCGLRRTGDCMGGCLAAAMLRAHRHNPEVTVRAPAPHAKKTQSAGAPAIPKSWAIPYIDQAPGFWESLHGEYGAAIREVYFPITLPEMGTGRPVQPTAHLEALLRARVVPMAVLVNPLVLPGPLERIGGRIVDELTRLHEQFGVNAATVSDIRLAEMIRQQLPTLRLTASCLLDVAEPGQVHALRGVFDVLVPSTRVVRRPDRLAAIRAAFQGRIRLLVNEGCLDSCLDRKQHFYEMAYSAQAPRSLCSDRLTREAWLRLTGAWVLPQHLELLDPFADEFKLAGRVTLCEPGQYRRVLDAYLGRRALWPHEIGGGPASVLMRAAVSRALFQRILHCDHICGGCSVCQRVMMGQWEPEAPA